MPSRYSCLHSNLTLRELKPALLPLHPVQKRFFVEGQPVGGLGVFRKSGHRGKFNARPLPCQQRAASRCLIAQVSFIRAGALDVRRLSGAGADGGAAILVSPVCAESWCGGRAQEES